MTLSPLLSANPVIQLHAFAAMVAFVLGIVQFVGRKGNMAHRVLGWIWVLLLAAVSLSSFFIHGIRLWGPFSPIHLLSIFSLVMLVLGVRHARRHAVGGHRKTMIAIFVGGLVIAGGFTFLPGRIMHDVLLGH